MIFEYPNDTNLNMLLGIKKEEKEKNEFRAKYKSRLVYLHHNVAAAAAFDWNYHIIWSARESLGKVSSVRCTSLSLSCIGIIMHAKAKYAMREENFSSFTGAVKAGGSLANWPTSWLPCISFEQKICCHPGYVIFRLLPIIIRSSCIVLRMEFIFSSIFPLRVSVHFPNVCTFLMVFEYDSIFE